MSEIPDRILLVDDVPETLNALAELIGGDFEVVAVLGSARALEVLEREGPFAVLLSDYDMPGLSGTALIERADDIAPDCVPVLITGLADCGLALEAPQRERVFRILAKPCRREELLDALREAVLEHHARRDRSVVETQFDLATGVLGLFDRDLEGRRREESARLDSLHRFVGDLGRATSLGEIAALVARAAANVVAPRRSHVELWSSHDPLGGVEAGESALLDERRLEQPIETAEGRVGRLTVEARDARGVELDANARSLLSALCSTTAVAAHNQLRREERDAAQHAAIVALARLAERRDNETGAHLERVSLYCRLIAEGLVGRVDLAGSIDARFVADLVRAAPLHDIGKVGVPDVILLKPGRLDDHEWEIMKRHTTIGAETLASAIVGDRPQPFLEMCRDIAGCHHERWDGRGYPRGLAGDAIPLAARIVALADVYDALTSVRPYKQAWTHARALEWVRAGAGAHFDPRVVAAFVARGDEVDAIRERLADRPEDVARHLAERSAAA
ncbi:MAG TPA: HD domain-containing phosphohydrolase [Planctomycetota bacterium]|nr:HD domain-containing phosphohydrolase [Planctomycetota bacterium]